MRGKADDRDAAARLRALDLEAHLADPALKQSFVTPMFDVIAPRYDRFTRLFSFGMDRGWKRELLALVERSVPANARVLDLACGTGDLALDMVRVLPGSRVTGLDASSAMIALANARRTRAAEDRVRFLVGDMARLDLPDASIDLVTASYGFRNVPDHRAALREAARVLKPGGRVFTLDFYRPEHPLLRRAMVSYLTLAGGLVGWLWHRTPVVYAYLGPSVEHFVSWRSFAATMEENGLTVEHISRKLFGTIAIHAASKR
jgi:demethylmenaquinone methyltransferase/2-methoxy-6-polyprenyl-1,4-benzoquinol methylase